MTRSALFAALLLLLSCALFALPAFPLKISSGKRCLTDQNNVPFLINGDTPWSLMVGTTYAEAAQYLNDRQQRGFTALIVNLLEHKFSANPPNNKYGQGPFTVPGDFSTPNEAYFAYADSVLRMCDSRGIVVFLAPCYLGYGCGDEGWCAEMVANGVTKCRDYGRYVGNRYRNFGNIVWLEGCDAAAASYTGAMAAVDAIAYGIKDADTVNAKLHTAHCSRQNSALDCYDRPWLDLNSTYSECSQTLAKSQTDWGRLQSRGIPFFYVEGRYENESGATAVCLRSQAYWSILSGSSGHFFGNCPVWHFGYSSSWCGLTDWVGQLSSAGSQSMTHVKALFHSREWQKLVPDMGNTVVTAGYGTDMATGLTSDSATLIAYMPGNRQVTVDLAKFSGTQVAAWWFNPSTGTAAAIGSYAKSGTRNFTPPGSADWVLVADDAGRGFSTPGAGDLYLGTEGKSTVRRAGVFLSPGFPNPFKAWTRISWYPGPDEKGPAVAAVYDLFGRYVRSLTGRANGDGMLTAVFDGRDGRGALLPNGIYLCRLAAGKSALSRRLVLSR